ncbi:TLC domain-containing protein 2-like [Tachypleus tridentatus]|uniref:TLC domain-containing protein 2-like n=1 Tax=Tachypleus tridentatus TaxID=6853 RepID=UPI003FD60102
MKFQKMAEDMIEIHTNKSHLLVAFSTGYFIYDFIDMSSNHRCRNSYELMVHHAFVILCFGITVCTKLYVGYALAALLVEVNNIFLHLRQLMVIVSISKSNPWYRLNSLANLATFILFRVVTLAWMTRWLVVHRELVPLYAYTCGSIGLAAIVLMSIVLFFRLLNSDFGPKRNKEGDILTRPNEAFSLELTKKKD